MADTTLRPIQNGFETTLVQDLNTTDLTFYCADVPDATIPSGKKVAVVLSAETTNQEIVLVESRDTSNNTMTVSVSGRAQNLGNGLAGTANEHTVGAKVIISDDYSTFDDYGDAIDSKVNIEGDTMTGALSFSGTSQAGIKPNRLTTAQRTALVLGASDSAVVFDTDLGTYWGWDGASWNEFSEGTAVPNATTTVPGIVQLATQTDIDDGTDTSTGPLVVQPSQLNPSNLTNSKTTPTSADVLPLSDSADSNSLKKVTYGNLTASLVSKSSYTAKGDILVSSAASTPAAVTVGSNTTVLMADSTQSSGVKWASVPTRIVNIRTPVTATAAAETTLVSTTVAGGTLGTAGCVVAELNISNCGIGNGATLTLRYKYGGITFITQTAANSTGANVGVGGTIKFFLYANNDTSSQTSFATAQMQDIDIVTGPAVSANISEISLVDSTGAVAVDSTSNQTLEITAQWSVAGASQTITMHSASVISI